QYDYAQKVWEKAECKTFGDYHDLYLRTDKQTQFRNFEQHEESGNSMASRRLAKANFSRMKGYNKHKANKWLLYLDTNNLYGWAMSQYLLTGGFRWLDLDKLPDI
ncbi:19663_t:CDS:2, partial [Funneliformis geosporum]